MESTFYTNSATAFTTQETQLEQLQSELASGKAVNSAGAGATAYIGAAQDNSEIQQLAAEQNSQTNIQATLQTGTSTLGQATTLLDQLQSIALQAINATTSGLNYQALSDQVGQIGQQLLAFANSQDPQGNFVFSGTAKGTEPFSQNSFGMVSYNGNEGVSSVEISPGVTVNSALNGAVFMDGPSGNGFASVSAGTTNTGTATLVAAGASNQAAASAFQTGNLAITVSFSSSGGKESYVASQGGLKIGGGAVPTSTNSTMLNLDGIQFKLSGSPNVGDTFVITPSRPQSVFSLVSGIQSALSSPGSTPAQMAQTRQTLENALGGIVQYQRRFSSTSAKAGVILKSVTQSGTSDTTLSTADQTNAAALVGANIPQTLTQIEQQTAALQDSLKAFSSVQQLSLFSFIA